MSRAFVRPLSREVTILEQVKVTILLECLNPGPTPVREPRVVTMRAVVLFAWMAVHLAGAAGQSVPESPTGADQGKKIFVSRCAQCHNDDAAKKLPDGTTLLIRLSKSTDPETRLGTRLKKEEERRQVFLYLQPLIERSRVAREAKTP